MLFDIELPLPPPPLPNPNASEIPIPKYKVANKIPNKEPKTIANVDKFVKPITINELICKEPFPFFEPDIHMILDNDLESLMNEINNIDG